MFIINISTKINQKQLIYEKLNTIKLFNELLHPMHNLHIDPVKKYCDLILENNNLDSGCDVIISNFIKKVLKNEI